MPPDKSLITLPANSLIFSFSIGNLPATENFIGQVYTPATQWMIPDRFYAGEAISCCLTLSVNGLNRWTL